MTERATLEALLARVLEGTGPDEKIDGQLALLKGYTYEKHKGDKFAWWRRPNGWRIGTYGNENRPPPYTASLDAALTLVPEGWDWRRRSNLTMALVYGESEKYDLVAVHHEPCRALIAACLKARMEALGE